MFTWKCFILQAQIFRECRPEFLHDLVLKMRPLIFTPGDYVCRKGEVAREMYIISDGVLEILGYVNRTAFSKSLYIC